MVGVVTVCVKLRVVYSDCVKVVVVVTGTASLLQAELRMSGGNVARLDGVLAA